MSAPDGSAVRGAGAGGGGEVGSRAAGGAAAATSAFQGNVGGSRAPVPRVSIVGAGPGDPGLLTLKAAERLRDADFVLYDALVSPEILALVRDTSTCISVGKRRGKHIAEQEDIHTLLVTHARAGKRVVRLKGGDPFLFGRGCEEVEALSAAGIASEVVPGVTSALAAPAAAGIPVTHRDLAGAVVIATGHDAAQPARDEVRWKAIAESGHTVVVLMGLAELPRIAASVRAAGRPGATPVAVVASGTTPRQRVALGTLDDIVERVRAAGIEAPAVIVVGEVARFARVTEPVTHPPEVSTHASEASPRESAHVSSTPDVSPAPVASPAPSARRHAFPTADRDAVYRAIHTRRDVRAYLPDPVPADVLARVLDAAHHAPSVGFMQPWDFVLVDAPEARRAAYAHVRAVSEAAAARYPDDRSATYRALKLQGILDAPVSVVVTCDPTRGGPDVLGRPTIPETDTYSTCLAIQNLWLAARAEGLGVGWVSLYEPAAIRAIFGIPDHVQVIAWLTLGWPVELPDEPMLARVGWRQRIPVEALVHLDRWGAARPSPSGATSTDVSTGGSDVSPDVSDATAAARNEVLTKPPGSLGQLEDAALRIARVQGAVYPRSERKWLLLCAGDHGITEAGVSAYERRVTARMVLQFAADAGAVNVFARATGTRVRVADLGVDHAFDGATAVVDHKIARGTRSFLRGPAMEPDQARAARAAGRALVAGLGRCDILALGEMGIGNSTAAAAMAGALLGLDAAAVTGIGTGVGSHTLARKREVVAEGLRLHAGHDPLEAFGGFEIAGLVGAIEAAAERRIPVVLDGFITGVAALYAARVLGVTTDHLLAGHRSAEPGHAPVLAALDVPPLLDLGLRLGEGTGAVLALGLLDAACRTFREMRTFAEAGIADARIEEARR